MCFKEASVFYLKVMEESMKDFARGWLSNVIRWLTIESYTINVQNCGPSTNSSSVTWELIRYRHSQAPCQTSLIRHSEGGTQSSVFEGVLPVILMLAQVGELLPETDHLG